MFQHNQYRFQQDLYIKAHAPLGDVQEQMSGEAAKAGFSSEDDVAEWITQSRQEENAE